MVAREHRQPVRLSKQLPPRPLRINTAKPSNLKVHGSLAGENGVSHDLSNAFKGRARAETAQHDGFTAVRTKLCRPSQHQSRERHEGQRRRRYQDAVMMQSSRSLTRKSRARGMEGLYKLPHRVVRRVRSSLSVRARARAGAVGGTGQSSSVPEAPYESIPSRHLRPSITLQTHF